MKFISLVLISALIGITFASHEEYIGYRKEAIKEHGPHKGGCSKDEIRDKDGLCYPKVFKATNEFKRIIEGQIVPEGLNYQINFKTGEKMAKLLEKEGKDDNNKLILVEKDKAKSSPLNEKFKSHKVNSSDRSKFNEGLVQLKDLTGSKESIADALEVLEDLVHDLDFGLELVSNQVFVNLLDLLRPIWPSNIRMSSAKVIGSSLQNNFKAHEAIHKFDLPSKLLTYLSFENQKEVTAKLLYALSASVRNDELASEAFHRSNGFDILFKVYKFDLSKNVNKKVLNLLSDLMDPTMKGEEEHTKQQENSISFQPMKEWCNYLQVKIINLFNEDLAELWAQCLVGLTKVYPDHCLPNNNILKFIEQNNNNNSFSLELKESLEELKKWASIA